MEEQQPRFVNIKKLFNDYLFEIPKYQRPYSWTKTELDDLFLDVKNVVKKNRTHFMATLVTVNRGDVKSNRLEVVDGQQRLTSLCILLKAISLKHNGKDIHNLLFKNKNDKIIILSTNYDTKNFFYNFIVRGIQPTQDRISTVTEKNLSNAINMSIDFVKNFSSSNHDIQKLYEAVVNNLHFLLHIHPNVESVYTIFEVLNSRGKPVGALDKCKSILMSRVVEEQTNEYEKIERINTHWKNIFREISTHKIKTDEIVRFAATILDHKHTKQFMNTDDALKFFKKTDADFHRILDWHRTLEDITIQLSDLIKNHGKLAAIFQIIQVKFLFIAIRMRENIKEQDKNEILRQLEHVAFRTYGFGLLDSRHETGSYIKLAQEIIEKTKSDSDDRHSIPAIKKELKKLGEKYNIDKVVNNFAEKDLYHNTNRREELRYFFYKYEEYCYQKKKNPKIKQSAWEHNWDKIWNTTADNTIEHIMPQSGWSKEKKVFKNREEEFLCTHRLGNLTILDPVLNSEAGNKAFKEKKRIYREQNFFLMDDILIKNRVWNKKKIIKREKILLETAKDIWKDVY